MLMMQRKMIDCGANYNLINFLIDKCGYESYLEIGVRSFKTFDKVNCKIKYAVDPSPQGMRYEDNVKVFIETSDSFFKNYKDRKTTAELDLIFIDGDHSFSATYEDLDKSLSHLSEKGLIVMHDMDPPSRPWQGNGPLPSGWRKHPMGECWRSMVHRRILKNDIQVITIQNGHIETGLTVIKKGHDSKLAKYRNIAESWNFGPGDYWEFFEKNRQEILNVYPIETFNSKILEFLEGRMIN